MIEKHKQIREAIKYLLDFPLNNCDYTARIVSTYNKKLSKYVVSTIDIFTPKGRYFCGYTIGYVGIYLHVEESRYRSKKEEWRESELIANNFPLPWIVSNKTILIVNKHVGKNNPL